MVITSKHKKELEALGKLTEVKAQEKYQRVHETLVKEKVPLDTAKVFERDANTVSSTKKSIDAATEASDDSTRSSEDLKVEAFKNCLKMVYLVLFNASFN